MGSYLTRRELAELSGTTYRRKQIAWLAAQSWPFVLDAHGFPKVAREYHDRVLVGRTTSTTAPTPQPNLSAI